MISLIFLVSAFCIFYPLEKEVSDDDMLILKVRIIELENIVEYLSAHNHKIYLYIAHHKIDFNSRLGNDEVDELYDDRIAKLK